jgi:HEAT repeat protein
MMLQETINRFSERMRVASSEKRYTDTIKILDELRAELRAEPPSEDEVVALLQNVYNSKSVSDAQYGFIAAWSNLSSSYVPILCDIVAAEECQSVHEPAVELLSELNDPRAFETLKNAVSYRWDYDEWLHVPRKALQGLSRIGGKEAVEIIRAAANSEDEEIQNEAVDILDELDSSPA